jgi:FHA domain
VTLNVTFANGEVKTKAVTVKDGPASIPGVSLTPPKSDSIVDQAMNWVMQNQVATGAAAVISLGVLLLGSALLMRRGRSAEMQVGQGGYGQTELDPRTGQPTTYGTTTMGGGGMGNGAGGGMAGATVMAPPPAGETVILTPGNDRMPPQQIYAWLQFLDAGSSRVPIGSTNVRIGRHKDNDIILQNKTVHRQHAVLHMTPDKRFSINDLGGENGTMVNGQKCNQRDLSDGDMIELGEVRLRFFANNE